MAIEVRELLLVAEKGLLQCDVNVHIQIILHTLKNVVRLLLQYDNNIALQHVRHLFTLSLIHHLLVIGGSLGDVNYESLGFTDDLPAPTRRTVLLICASLALALVTGLLHLHLHEPHVLNDLHHARALALGTRLGFASFSSASLALTAVYVPADGHLLVDPIVQLLKSDFQVYFILRSFHAIVSTSLVAFYLILSLSVIDLSLDIVSEHL